MTMLKTYRKRRKRQDRRTIRHVRFLRLFGDPRLLPPLNLDEPLRWTNYTATYRGRSIDVLVIDEDVTESFNVTLNKKTCPQCKKQLDNGELLSCVRCGTKMCGCCAETTYNEADDTESFICERCYEKDCEESDA